MVGQTGGDEKFENVYSFTAYERDL